MVQVEVTHRVGVLAEDTSTVTKFISENRSNKENGMHKNNLIIGFNRLLV